MKHYIGQTQNNVAVHVNLVRSAAASRISAQPYLLGLVKEAVANISVESPYVRAAQDMGRDIGYDFVAETTENDAIFYAQLVRDKVFTRFVKNKRANATRHLAIILRLDEDGEYELLDTWIGQLSPPLPGSDDEMPESRLYWSNHAHIFERQPIQTRTLTKECPY